jgi:CHAT domain-containing protein
MQLPARSPRVIVALGILLCTAACQQATVAPTGRHALANAVGDTLNFRARLTGGFAPSKVGPTRAAGDRAIDLSPDTRIAIALLEKRATDTPAPDTLADLGVGYLVEGDVDRAIAALEDAASQMNAAAPWSDLSAAYLAKAERTPTRRVEYLAEALEAAERSVKVARTNEALFNRALARDGLAPYTGIPAPWTEYTAAESSPAWRQAATAEANNDRIVEDARTRWDGRRTELIAKLKGGDTQFVKETVRLYPEATTEFLEFELLVDPAATAQATLVASAIHEVTRDPMTRDEVAAWGANRDAFAAAHRTYAEGLSQFDANNLAAARRSFEGALAVFTRLNAPYRSWVEARLGAIDLQERQLAVAEQRLTRAEQAGRRAGYHSLTGRALWLRGIVNQRQWRLTDALAAFRESASIYETSGHREFAVGVYSNLSDALRMLGEPHESWAYIGRTLEEMPRLRKPIRRYLHAYNAALFAGRQGLNEAALLFQDAAVREAAANPRVLTEAYIQRGVVNIRRGNMASARADLDRASTQLESAEKGSFHSFMSAELKIARAQLPENQERSVADLQDSIAFFGKTDPGRVPGLYLLMARTAGARASRDVAERALRTGIEQLEAQQAGLGDETLRISYFDESWALFEDMVSLQVTAKDPAKAFEYAERSRARSLLAAAQGTTSSTTRTLPDIQAQLPPSTVMLHYSTLRDRILMWTISSSGTRMVERSIDERELSRLIEYHRAAIRDHREDRGVNDRLYNLLIEPVTSALSGAPVIVLVPDAQLQQLAFATLRHPSTRRYLIEDHALLVSPSASFFVDARRAAVSRSSSPLASALLIGNPSSGGARALPGAEAEVASVSKLYRRHEVLVGPLATKQRFVDLAPAFDVLHFGGHAFANPEFPLLSRLVFADEAEGEQSLYAHEIARLRFPRTRVVVLAACSTAAGAVSRGEGVVSVARPFLGGGVPLVIASQWDVDDGATEQLTLVFHRELAKSGDPVRALRTAQLTLLRSGDAKQTLPDSWGAFVAVGTMTQ